MKKYISSLTLAFTLLFNSCKPSNDYHLQGIIGTDESIAVNSVPEYSVAVLQKINGKKVVYCNGVKLHNGNFLGALHCFNRQKIGKPITTSGGMATETLRENKADLLIGKMVGNVAPSNGAKLFSGSLPLEIELEAYWFDPSTQTWRFSKGHGKRSSVSDRIWQHDLDLNPGASGAGLFFTNDSGERFLVGIHLGFAKTHNIGLVYVADITGKVELPNYLPELINICVGSRNRDGEIEWSCTDGEEGDAGGTGDSGEDGPQHEHPSEDGQQNGEGGTNDGDHGDTAGSPDDGSYSPHPGIEIDRTPGSQGNSGDTSGDTSDDGSQGGASGKLLMLDHDEPCFSCVFFMSEKDAKSLFKPGCDQSAGFNGIFGNKTPSSDRLMFLNVRNQTDMTGFLRALAEKIKAEKKWKTSEGMSKLSQLSEDTRKRLEAWLNKVIQSADDYYALIISSLNSMKKPDQPVFNDTEEGIKSARRYLDFLKKKIASNPDEFSDRRYSLLDASARLLEIADINLKNGNPENAYISLQMSLAIADTTLSLTPVLGWGKDVYEAWTGYSFSSGKRLTTLERSLAIGGAVSIGTLTVVGTSAKVFAAGTVVFKDAAKLAKTAEEMEQIEKATQNLIEMSKNAESAGVSANLASEGVRSTQKIIQEGKHLESVAQDGRSVYKTTTLNGGKIPSVADSVPDSIKKSIADGATNLDLMKKGNAPIGTDGRQINLHHIFGFEPGPIIEMEATAHMQQYKEFHNMIKESFRNEGKLGPKFDAFRKKYWMERAKDFIVE